MTIFDYINGVCFTKKHLDVDMQTTFSPFMLQRWISMYSPQVALMLNETTNSLWAGIKDNQQWYDMFYTIVPRLKHKRLNYIKKKNEPSDDKHGHVAKLLSDRCQISLDEAYEMIEMQPSIIDQFTMEKN